MKNVILSIILFFVASSIFAQKKITISINNDVVTAQRLADSTAVLRTLIGAAGIGADSVRAIVSDTADALRALINAGNGQFPSSITGLAARYLADSVTLQADTVITWQDISSNSYNLTSSLPAYFVLPNRDIRVATDTINTHNALRFDGSLLISDSTAQIYTTTATIFTVFLSDGVSAYSEANFANIVNYDTDRGTEGTDARNAQLFRANYVSNKWEAIAWGSGGANTISSSTASDSTSWHYSTTVIGSSALTLKIDGLQVATAAHTPINTLPTYFVIGGNISPFVTNDAKNETYFDGYLAEVIVYNRELTASEINQVETYLAARYGL